MGLLMVLACCHATRSIFFDNVSWIDLHKYALGQERMPFQGRVGMMLPLRFAGNSALLGRLAAKLDQQDKHQVGRRVPGAAEPVTAEKVMAVLVGLLSDLAALALMIVFGRRHSQRFWWLPGVLFLVILYSSYGARYEEAYWYPYDLPHMLLFGAACLCLLEGPLWPVLPLFVLDTCMRETSLYLVLLAMPAVARRYGTRRMAAFAAAMVVCWLGIRLPIMHHFAQNASETGPRLFLNTKNLLLPLHWPQMASAIGFLYVPVWLGRRSLSRTAQHFLWASLPCIAVTAVFGIWIESRIFLEWTIPVAALASVEALRLIGETPTSEL